MESLREQVTAPGLVPRVIPPPRFLTSSTNGAQPSSSFRFRTRSIARRENSRAPGDYMRCRAMTRLLAEGDRFTVKASGFSAEA